MNKSTKNGSDVKDAQNQPKKELTIADVDKLLQTDLHTAILCLQSVHGDPDARLALATVLHGKYLNKLHAQALAQTEAE